MAGMSSRSGPGRAAVRMAAPLDAARHASPGSRLARVVERGETARPAYDRDPGSGRPPRSSVASSAAVPSSVRAGAGVVARVLDEAIETRRRSVKRSTWRGRSARTLRRRSATAHRARKSSRQNGGRRQRLGPGRVACPLGQPDERRLDRGGALRAGDARRPLAGARQPARSRRPRDPIAASSGRAAGR